jgi:hypothetical protein
MKTIYLNEFNKDKILQTIIKISEMKIDRLVFNIDVDKKDGNKYATLSYDNYLHKITASGFNPDKKPMFENPTCICEIAPIEVFLNSLTPSLEYYKLIGV